MDPQVEQSQQTIISQPIQAQASPQVQKLSTLPKILLSSIGIIFVLGLIGTAYYLGMKSNTQATSKITSNKLTPINPTNSEGIEKGFQSLSYAVIDGKIVLQYRGNYYKEDANSLTPAPTITLKNYKNYKWTRIIDTPVLLDPNATDSVFSFRVIPGTENFLFVMEWSSTIWSAFINGNPAAGEGIGGYYAYYNNAAQHRVNSVKLTGPSVVDQISSDKKFASVIEYGCWGCDGHKSPLTLVNLQDLTVKDIGDVDDFAWGENGNYTYKEYKIIPCTTPQPGDCTQDPATLPTLHGKF